MRVVQGKKYCINCINCDVEKMEVSCEQACK